MLLGTGVGVLWTLLTCGSRVWIVPVLFLLARSPGVDLTTCFGPCNGHGTCQPVAVNSTQTYCECDSSGHFNLSDNCATCNPNWTTYNCDQCDSAHYGPNCTKPCKTDASGSVCSGNGACYSGTTGNGSCACNTGFTGAVCDKCLPGYFGPSCNACNDCHHGICNDVRPTSSLCRLTQTHRGLVLFTLCIGHRARCLRLADD